jgi:alpha-tubulin suppressor-like RCC1 family protein
VTRPSRPSPGRHFDGTSAGAVTITAAIDDVSGDAAVSVLAPVATLTVEPGDVDLRRGRLTYLRARLTDDQGNELRGRAIAWTSNDPQVVRVVGSDGRVEGLTDGQATVLAVSEDVSGSATIRVQSAGFLAVSAGTGHTCALTLDGSGWCWGGNDHGQLGTGDKSPGSTPRAVAGGLVFSSIAAGAGYTCAVTPTGDLCYGFECSMSPRPVSGSRRYASISTGRMHTCAIATDESLFCWGDNGYGQVGDGTFADATAPTRIEAGRDASLTSAPATGIRAACSETDRRCAGVTTRTVDSGTVPRQVLPPRLLWPDPTDWLPSAPGTLTAAG